MVTLLLDQAQLEVALSPIERTLAFRRKNIRIDRRAIAKVQLTDDPWTWLRGVQDPGTHLPGVVAMGTWKSVSGADFAVIRGKRPGVVIDVSGEGEFQRIVLTTRHGLALVSALREELDAEADAQVVATPKDGTPGRGSGKGRPSPSPPTSPVPVG